jgi:TRAP-type C4-dicarboxylate transport system substrate-binding protein
MKKTMLLAIFLLITSGCVFVLYGDKATAATIELKFAHPFPPKQVCHEYVFAPWAEKINKLTNGKVKVTFFPGGALGKAPDHYEMVEKGIVDIIFGIQHDTPGRFPLTNAFELPFMITTATKTSEAMWKCYQKIPEFKKEYNKVKPLALFCHPGAYFSMAKKPITKLDDFKGMKIRSGAPYVSDALKIFGAVPVDMPVMETYTALERGVVDGTVLPWEGIYNFKLTEVLKYVTETAFYTVPMMAVMNKDKWNSLPDDVKKVIDETTGMVMSLECGKIFDTMKPRMKDLCVKAGIQVIEFQPGEEKKLHSLTMPIRDEWVENMKSRGLPGKAFLDSALQFLEEK